VNIQFWSIGKAHEAYVQPGIEIFTGRIQHYYPVNWKLIPPVKNAPSLSETDLKKNEADAVLKLLEEKDILVLLDEKGKMYSSEMIAGLIRENADRGNKNLVFLVGGAFGVDERIKKRANYVWSLSALVFPHQLVRLILSEQVYRACTINRNEKYHHT
jgi:23S rRNA (pseudouridine1915-N3)-methyltransferase